MDGEEQRGTQQSLQQGALKGVHTGRHEGLFSFFFIALSKKGALFIRHGWWSPAKHSLGLHLTGRSPAWGDVFVQRPKPATEQKHLNVCELAAGKPNPNKRGDVIWRIGTASGRQLALNSGQRTASEQQLAEERDRLRRMVTAVNSCQNS